MTSDVEMAEGLEIGQQVRISGKRGCYRVVGFRPGAVQLMDDDQKWHVVRPEAVRPMAVPQTGRSKRIRHASG